MTCSCQSPCSAWRNNGTCPLRRGQAKPQKPNARGEPRPEAGAERTLEGVGSTAMFGPDAGTDAVQGFSSPRAPGDTDADLGCALVRAHPTRATTRTPPRLPLPKSRSTTV